MPKHIFHIADGFTERVRKVPLWNRQARASSEVNDYRRCQRKSDVGHSTRLNRHWFGLLPNGELLFHCAANAGSLAAADQLGVSRAGTSLHWLAARAVAIMGVKAAGGVRDLKAALAMIEAGATRIGTSNGVAIVEEFAREYPSGAFTTA
jgi:hypothetical protein